MRAKIRNSELGKKTEFSLEDIAKEWNPILRGWLNYYRSYNRSALAPVLWHFNKALIAWVMRKFKKFRRRKGKATRFTINLSKEKPQFFAHWKIGFNGSFT